MNLLILEPPYSHLFHDLAKELRPEKTFVHLFNIGYLIYLPGLKFILISKELKKIVPKPESIEEVKSVRSLANSNIKAPGQNDLTIMAAYMDYLSAFIKENSITHILCHNDLRWQHAIAKEVARKTGVSILFSEEGLFRPHTMTLDSKGVNAFSSIPRDSEFYLKNNFQKKDSFKLLKHSQLKRAMRLIYFVTFILLNNLGDSLGLNISLKNKKYSFFQYLKLFLLKVYVEKTPTGNEKIPEKFIFVPLQVNSDTQTIIHSRFKGTQNIINLIETSYRALPAELRNEYKLVFRKHPMESHIQYNFGKDSIESLNSTSSLLKECSLVVLVNSTTTVEALINKKKVITLGDSIYNINGLTYQSSESSLVDDMQRLLLTEESPRKELVSSFLDFLKYHYQVNGNIFYYDKQTIKEIKQRFYA